MRYLILIAALLAGAAGYGIYWYRVAGAIEPGIAAWAEERRGEGLEVRYAEVEVTGFPFRLVVSVRRPEIERPLGATPWHWHGEALSAVAQPWNFSHLILSFDGRHRLSYLAGGEVREVGASAEVPLVSLVFDGAGRLERFAADLKRLEVTASVWREPLRAARLQLHGRAGARPGESGSPASSDYALKAEDMTLPEAARGPLGTAVALVESDLTVTGGFREGPLAEALAAWRDDGGTVEVRTLDVAWGPLDFEASGTLALDQEMRPIGAATARIVGYAKTIDALETGRWMAAKEAATAKAVLGLLAREEQEGQVLTVPLSAQEGRLYVGPLPLLRLPPLLPPPLKKLR